MPDSVVFDIFVAYPPYRDGRVAQLTVTHDALVDIPAEVYREGDETMIALFGRSEGVAWEYALHDFLRALDAAVAALDGPALA